MWLKVSDDFGVEARDLSDAAFRTHVEGLLWVMARETGGFLHQKDVARFAESDRRDAAVRELLEEEYWVPEGSGYRIVHHMEHQIEPEVASAKRRKAAERQRRHRAKAAGLPEPPSRGGSRRDGPGDATRDPGRVRTGRDGTSRGGAQLGEGDEDWPAVVGPGMKPSRRS
jgi:hypothetical protein